MSIHDFTLFLVWKHCRHSGVKHMRLTHEAAVLQKTKLLLHRLFPDLHKIVELLRQNEVRWHWSSVSLFLLLDCSSIFGFTHYHYHGTSNVDHLSICFSPLEHCVSFWLQVEGIVLQRYGRECCRIFRLLALKGQLEQKQVWVNVLIF